MKRLADALAEWQLCCQVIKAMKYGAGLDTVNSFLLAERRLKGAIKGVQQWE